MTADLGSLARALPWTAPTPVDPVLELGAGVAFADPWFLALAPLGVLLLVLRARRRFTLAAPSPRPRGAAAWPRSLRQRWLFVPPVLEALAWALVSLALARPLAVDVLETREAAGIDIFLVLDRSGSMQFTDLSEPGREQSRLDVVREVALEFAERRTQDTTFAADRVGLIAFARYPELVCPPTLDAATLAEFARRVTLPTLRQEDGTGIGVALAKAVELLGESDAASKVVVLLSDGANNVELIQPDEAAELAASRGVRVYTILAGRYEMAVDPFGRIVRQEGSLDSSELENIAKTTGGRFFRARDKGALEAIYAEIEQLERTPREERRERRAHDLYAPFVAAGLAALTLARLLHAAGLARTFE